jgi:hypothetical protein
LEELKETFAAEERALEHDIGVPKPRLPCCATAPLTSACTLPQTTPSTRSRRPSIFRTSAPRPRPLTRAPSHDPSSHSHTVFPRGSFLSK